MVCTLMTGALYRTTLQTIEMANRSLNCSEMLAFCVRIVYDNYSANQCEFGDDVSQLQTSFSSQIFIHFAGKLILISF